MATGLIRWEQSKDGVLTEAALRRKLEGMGYRVTRNDYPAGTHFGPHMHDVDRMAAVLSGRLRVVLAGKDVMLGPGDAVAIPQGTVHSTEALGGGEVIAVDAIRF